MDAAKLDETLARYSAEHNFSGNVRVSVGDEIIFDRFYGMSDFEKGVPFCENSRFSFYSLSKPFCALGLLRLCDAGLVDLDAHPGKYVREAAAFDPRLKVRHLLLHTSGIPEFFFEEEFRKTHPTGYRRLLRGQLLDLAAFPQYFEPGKGFRYSNVNFIVCALIIEEATGQKYVDYMQKEVFDVLGAKTAILDDEGVFVPDRVMGYELVGERKPVGRTLDWLFGAGDITGRADDVFCLNKAYKERLILKDETWETVLTPSGLSTMGMGCNLAPWHGKKRIMHNGGHLGFRTLHVMLPDDDFDLIVLSNCGEPDARNAVSETVYGAYFGTTDTDSEKTEMDKGYADK